MKKTKKFLKLFLWSGFGVVALIALLAGRLAMGPMSVQFLSGFFTAPIEKAFPDLNVEFQNTLLQWDQNEGTLNIQLSDVSIKGNEATLDASFPFVGITFSRLALYKGEFYPSRIELIGPEVILDWSLEQIEALVSEGLDNEGLIETISGTGLKVAQKEKPYVIELFERLLQAPQNEGLFGYLIKVGLSGGKMTFIETQSQESWTSNDASISFSRGNEGFDLAFDLTLKTGQNEAEIRGRSSNGDNGEQNIFLNLKNLNFATLAQSVNSSQKYYLIDMPLFGDVEFLLNKGILENLNFDIALEEGHLNLPDFFDNAPLFEGILLKGRYHLQSQLITLTNFDASFGGSNLIGDGLIELSNEEGVELDLIAEFTDLNIRTLLNYWSPKFGKGGRTWIDLNIPEGTITNAKFNVDIDPGDLKTKPYPEKVFRIDFQYEDLKAHYFKPMPIMERASGYGFTTPNYLELHIEKGVSDGINLANTIFKINNMGNKELIRGFVEAKTEGRVRKVLQFIDNQPLGFANKFGINPMEISGDVDATTTLNFPLIKGTLLKDVEIKSEAILSDVAMPNLVSNGGLEDTNLNLTITKEGLTANGSIVLKGAPFDLYWTNDFSKTIDNQYASKYDLRGVLNKTHLANFGLPIEDVMTGSIRTRLVVEGKGQNLIRGRAENDLFSGGFKSNLLGWEKKINTPGRVVFDLNWTEETLEFENIVADTAGLYAKGKIELNKNTSELTEAQFLDFKTRENEISLIANGSMENGYELVVDGQEIGLGPLLESMSTGQGPSKIPPLSVLIRTEKATGLNEIKMTNLHLSAHNSGDFWEWVDISGQMEGQDSFNLTLSPYQDKAGRELKLSTTNAGKLALAAGLFINGDGGLLDLAATMNAKGEESLITGELNVDDFRLVKSSALVEALAAAKGKEVDSMIGDNGISFSELNMPFKMENGIIDISDAGAHGPSIGFTMQGQLDQSMKEIHVNGVILPVYALNSLLGSIPIVGQILTGGDGGVFGVNYRIEGTTQNPKVSVNALSAFAPGFLRKIFAGKKGKLAPSQISPSDEKENGATEN